MCCQKSSVEEKPDRQKQPQQSLALSEKEARDGTNDSSRPFFRAEILECRPRGDDSDYRWDIDGWYGGTYNRLWVKTEGESDTAFKAGRNVDLQLLYGRTSVNIIISSSVYVQKHKPSTKKISLVRMSSLAFMS